MKQFLSMLWQTAFFFSILRITAPILFAALGAVVSEKAGCSNIGLEGIMMISALFGALFSYWAQSWAVGVLAAVGGLDLAAMTGAFLGCAAARLPAVVDGYISAVAAVCAVRLCPAVREYLFLSHASYEPGYRLAAAELALDPPLLLGMRLGEGSGCPIFFRVLEAACAAMNDMATFAEAEIPDDYLAPIRAQDSFTVKNE